MSESNELHANQSENFDFESLTQPERMVLQMFRKLDHQQQNDILRFIEVLLSKK